MDKSDIWDTAGFPQVMHNLWIRLWINILKKKIKKLPFGRDNMIERCLDQGMGTNTSRKARTMDTMVELGHAVNAMEPSVREANAASHNIIFMEEGRRCAVCDVAPHNAWRQSCKN